MDSKSPASAKDQHDIIYALRTAHQNQTQLNIMADQKANIIIGTIVIFLTFLVTRYNFADFANLREVLLVTVAISFEIIALILGIMVIQPRGRWSNHKLSIDDMPNPLFFGFFTRFSEQEYVDFMLNKLNDNSSARELLLKDYYQIGLVLKRKFSLLKYTYHFAFGGILLGIIALGFKVFPT